MPRIGALAIAAAITGDRIRMTNHPWSFSVQALRDRLGFERLIAINDFTAVALAMPRLGGGDRMPVGGGAPVAGADRGARAGFGARRLRAGAGRLRLGGAGGRGRTCDDGAGEPNARALCST